MGDVNEQALGGTAQAERRKARRRDRRRGARLVPVGAFVAGLVLGVAATWAVESGLLGSPASADSVTLRAWKVVVFPKPFVLVVVSATIGFFGYTIVRAFVEGFREPSKVRIKIGDRVVEYTPGISDEEFDRMVSEALQK